MSIFSVTERQGFKSCRRRWWLSSFNGAALTAAMPAPALNIGTVWHKGQDVWANKGGDLHKHILAACEENHAAIEASLTQSRGHGLMDEEVMELHNQRDLLEAMGINYQNYYGAPIPDGFEYVQAEQTIIIDIPDTPHKLEATLDGLLRNKSTGQAYILEHKTYGQRPREDALLMGDQFTAYAWVLSKLGLSPDGPADVLYDGVWKRPAPPRGRTFDELFLRMTIPHNQAELDEFEAMLIEEVQDMSEALAVPAKRYKNRDDFVAGCSYCGFKEICTAMSRGEDDQVEAIIASSFVPRDIGSRGEVWPQALAE